MSEDYSHHAAETASLRVTNPLSGSAGIRQITPPVMRSFLTDSSGVVAPTTDVSHLMVGRSLSSKARMESRVEAMRTDSAIRAAAAMRSRDPTPSASMATYETGVHSRHTSRRKMRRWESERLFTADFNDVLLRGMRQLSLGDNAAHRSTTDEDLAADITAETMMRMVRTVPFRVELRSAFEALFRSENSSLLDAFRRGDDLCDTDGSSVASTIRGARADRLRSQKIAASRTVEERSWAMVQRRLRSVVLDTVAKSVSVARFLADVEEVLMFYATTGTIPASLSDNTVGSSGLTSFDDCDISVGENRIHLMSRLVEPLSVDSQGNLRIVLQDSSFHRLLIHAACQFYGLTSQSFLQKGSPHKAMLIRSAAAVASAARSIDVTMESESEGDAVVLSHHNVPSKKRSDPRPAETVREGSSLLGFLLTRVLRHVSTHGETTHNNCEIDERVIKCARAEETLREGMGFEFLTVKDLNTPVC